MNTKHQLICKCAHVCVRLNIVFFYLVGFKEVALQLLGEFWNPESTADVFAPNCKLFFDGGTVVYGAKSK